jgi:HSP20 family protein
MNTLAPLLRTLDYETNRWVDGLPDAWPGMIRRPASDVYEERDAFTVRLEAPGMDRETLKVTLENGILSVRGDRTTKIADGVRMHRQEIAAGEFCRTFKLTSGIQKDRIEASYKDGLLTIRLPKAEEAKTRDIEIKL